MDILGSDDGEELDLTPLWLRRLTWDSLPCEMVTEVHDKLGLVPSDDQDEQDHIDSHERLSLIEPLVPSVEYLTPMLSQVLSEAIIMTLPKVAQEQITDDLKSRLRNQNEALIRTAALTMVAQFISTGVLEFTPKINNISGEEGDDGDVVLG